MSDTARKMFPVETVLALAVAKKGADVKDIAGYITGRSIVCDACAAAVAPFAAAWLAKLSPKFLDMNYKDGDNWGDFVNQGARLLGDTISLTPMDDCLKNAVATVLDMMDDMHGTMVSQRAEIATLRQQVETLAPYQGKAEELQKKCDKLEDTIKTMKTDMGEHMFPPTSVSEENQDRYSEIMSQVKTLADEMEASFICGTTPMSEWDSYQQKLKDAGIEEAVQMMQEAYDTYMAN